jgi:hypothetical protein
VSLNLPTVCLNAPSVSLNPPSMFPFPRARWWRATGRRIFHPTTVTTTLP